MADEKDRITAAGATIENGLVNGLINVTRSLGDLQLKRFGVISIPTFAKFELADSFRVRKKVEK